MTVSRTLVLTILIVIVTIIGARKNLSPDPYWYNLAFNDLPGHSGQNDRRDNGGIPVPIDFLPDTNPEAVAIPAGAPTVTFGVVISDMSGYDDYEFNILHEQGIRMFAWRANSGGKLIINNTVHWVDIKALSGGPDCASFLIEYEYLITVAQVDFLFHPVNPNCTQLAFLAEAYTIPLLNAPDFALGIYQDIPFLPYYNLTQLYTVAANYSLIATSCLEPVVAKGAKTIALMSAGTIGQGVIPSTDAVIGPLGLTRVLNDTLLDLDKQQAASTSSDPCSYVRPYIKSLIAAKPDIFVYSMGPTYTDEFTICMRKESYYPPAYWIFTANTLVQTSQSWMTSLSLLNDFWLDGYNVSDPLLISVTDYQNDYLRQWGDAYYTLVAYAATTSTAGTLALEAINLANSIDPEAFRTAMHSLNISTVIGQTYLVPGTQIFYHPFFCRQLGNGANSNSSYIIFPTSENSAPVVYPADVDINAAFAASLLPHSWWTRGRKIGVGVGIGAFVLFIIAGGIVLYYLFVIKYHVITIPKDENGPGWGVE